MKTIATANSLKQIIADANNGKSWVSDFITASEVEVIAAEVIAAGGRFFNADAFKRWQARGVTSPVLNAFVVPGVSEAVVMYRAYVHICKDDVLTLSIDNFETLLIDGRQYFVKGQYGDRVKTHSLYIRDRNTATEKAERDGWRFDEPAPKKIGKATAKRLREWAAYLDRKEAAAAEYIAKGKSELDNLLARLDASGVEYTRRGDDKIDIYNGLLVMTATISAGAVYFGRPEVDCSRLYAAYKGAASSYLELMLNLKMQY